MRRPRWLFEDYLLMGTINGLVGIGGAGKGTLISWLAAKLTRGELPGELHGAPATVLLVGDEDDLDEVWTPRVVVAGGDEPLVHTLQYDDGRPLELVRDIERLEQLVRELDAKLVYVDQVLDHFAADASSHVAGDVRRTLTPLRLLAKRCGIAACYTTHPNKLRGGSTRDRAGGSHQFTDLPRSMLALGWHPERDGFRALARAKGNVGKVPPALCFTIETGFASNPASGEIVECGMVGDLELDPELTAEDILPQPPRDRPEAKPIVAERVLRELGADGDWHSRSEALEALVREGVAPSTARDVLPQMWFIEREQRGRETWWRVKD
jgi:AAA domain